MNNKLILQLINNNIIEIQSLINHFQKETNDLENGFPMLESRLESLKKDVDVLKSNLTNYIITSSPKKSQNTKSKHIAELKTDFEMNSICSAHDETEEEKQIDSHDPSEKEVKLTESKEGTIEPSILNDRLQASRGDNIQEQIQKSKLVNIQSAIGINDQFLFIRELFDNNSEEYKAAISYIDTQNNYTEIVSYFDKIRQWDNENENVIQFFDLIKRKFE